MVRERYLQQLDLLKRSVLSLGEMSELIFKNSMEAVIDLNVMIADKTLLSSPTVDKLEEEFEASIFDLLALQQPMASDLRLIVSALKIKADITKIVELSINIAKIPGKFEGGHIKPLTDTKKMAEITAYMLENSIKAFEAHDSKLARAIAARDDEVDKLFYAVWVELIEMMAKDTAMIPEQHICFF